MRVHSILEVNTNHQQNPSTSQNVGSVSSGDKSSGISFDDYLRSFIQQSDTQTVSRQEEDLAASMLWGRFPNLRVSSKVEPDLKDDA